MNQQSTKCDIPDHKLEDIMGLCFDTNCQQKPEFCYLCKTEGRHQNHQQNCKRFNELKKILIIIKNTFIEQRKDLLAYLQIVTQFCSDLLNETYQKYIDDCDKLITITQEEKIKESIEQITVLEFCNSFDTKTIGIFISQIQEICIGFKDKIDELIRNNEISIQLNKTFLKQENSNIGQQSNQVPQLQSNSKPLSESQISNKNDELEKNQQFDNLDPKIEQEIWQNDVMNEDDDAVLQLQIQMIQEQEQQQQFQMMQQSEQLTEQAKQNRNNPQMAIKLLDEAIQLFENNDEALFLKGKILLNQEKYVESMQTLEKCIQQNSQFWQAHSLYADCLLQFDRLEEAQIHYQKAIAINPNESSLYSNKGNVLNLQGRYQEAIVSCNKAIDLNPENSSAHNNKAYALSHLNNYKDALNYYDKALQLNQNSIDILHNKGSLLIKMNRINEAVVCLEQMEQIPEKSPKYFNFKTTLLIKQGKWNEAREVCKQGLLFYPNDQSLLSQKYSF